MSICVAIPTYGREKYLLDSVQQLLDQERPPDEIIAVDQTLELTSTPERAMGQLHQNGCIRHFKCAPPNPPAARNLALRETTCDIILFIDDDVVLPRDFVARHLSNYDNQEVTAVAGGVIQQNWTPPRQPGKTWPKIMVTFFLDRSADRRIEDIATLAGGNHFRARRSPP